MHRLSPGEAVRRDLDAEVVVAREPRLGPTAEGPLKDLRGGSRRTLLVEDEAVIAAAAGSHRNRREERGVRDDRQTVDEIGRAVDAEQRQGRRQLVDRLPGGAVEDERPALCFDVRDVAGSRREEAPRAGLEQRDAAVLRGEGAARTDADEIALALGRRGGGHEAVALLDGELHERVEGDERLVVGHVLLRLPGGDEGQAEVDGVGHR